jgi:rubrerythrin
MTAEGGALGTLPSEPVTKSESHSCEDCDEFQVSKSFSGVPGTLGDYSYDAIDVPEECPVCGGDIVTQSTDED